MRILIVNTVRFRLNGITSVILNYYRNMDRTDMQIDFVVPNEISEEYRAELEGCGSRIFHLPRKKNPLAYALRLYWVIKENRYDVIHVHGNSAMMTVDLLPAWLAGVKVRIAHSHNTTCSHMKAHKLLLPLFRRCYTHGFACGEDAGRWLFGSEPFEVLKNGIDLRQYRYDEVQRQEFRNRIHAEDRIVLGHVGNFIEQKNHAFLLDWFKLLADKNQNVLLLLISDGALMDAMKEKAHLLGLDDQVLFLGKTTEMPGYMQAMDLFVLPSLHEGLPVVLVEAQAAGLRCYVADTVTRETDLTDSIRFLPITDGEVWADTIQDHLVSAQNRTEDCENWQRAISEAGYDVTRNADRMRKLYSAYCQ